MKFFPPRIWVYVVAAAAGINLTDSAVAQEEPVTPTKNLLVNGSFEKGLDGWKIDANQKKGRVTVDETEKRNGKPSLKIENSEADDVHVTQSVPVEPDTRYRLEGYIKTKDVVPAKRESKDGACLAIEGGYKKSQIVTKTRSWTKVTLEFVTGQEKDVALGARLGFYYGIATGTAWYSDLSVVRVGKAPPRR